jgi:hypothetical protein
MPNGIRETRVLVPAITAALVLMAPTLVYAQQGLHFVGTPTVTATKTDDSAFLTATGEVAGAGRTATATLSATAVTTVGCITPSGSNEPRGLQTQETQVTGSETFNTRQGRGTFDVDTNAVGIPSSFNCPSANMEETLVSVVFEDVTLTVTSQTGTITQEFGTIDP